MNRPDRRTFLKRAAGAVPAAAAVGSLGLEGCADPGGGGADVTGSLTTADLHPLADVVLPAGSLGEGGVADAVARFVTWLDGFRPEAERTHAYLDHRIRYGPPHPGPRWREQLEALETAARRDSGRDFGDLPVPERRALVTAAIPEDVRSLPSSPARAEHVAIGLLAWFFGSSEANDLCYGRRIGRARCRGIESLPRVPEPLDQAGEA